MRVEDIRPKLAPPSIPQNTSWLIPQMQDRQKVLEAFQVIFNTLYILSIFLDILIHK